MTTAISGTGAANAAASTQTKAKNAMSEMGAGDFLKLLTTQLTNQDPTAPVDNAQMVAQLAQFSTLSNTTSMADTLKEISAKLDKLSLQPATPTPATTPAAA